MIQTLHDTGADHDIQSKYDGGVYQVATNDCIIADIGDEFTLNYDASSLTVSFNAGSQAVIGGSFFKIVSVESITLQANSTIYLCANIDLTRPNGTRGQFVQRTLSNMKSDNLNGTGSSRDLLLYVVQTSASGVTYVEDKRVIKSEALKDVGFGIDATRKICNLKSDSTITWTATEDCYVWLFGGAYGRIVIDDVAVAYNPNGNFAPNNMWLPIKKGTTILVAGMEGNCIWAWGLKGNV